MRCRMDTSDRGSLWGRREGVLVMCCVAGSKKEEEGGSDCDGDWREGIFTNNPKESVISQCALIVLDWAL